MPERLPYHLINPADPRWLEFITSSRDASIFHHPSWVILMSECYQYPAFVLITTDRQGEITAGLPLMKVCSPITGRRWVALPYSDYCGPLYRDAAALEELTAQLISLYQTSDVSRIEVRGTLTQQPLVHAYSDFVIHTVQLHPDVSNVAKHFKRTHLQNIHTAEERGITVKYGNQLEDLRTFYGMQLETRKRHGIPSQPWKYFELLWQHIIRAGMGFVLLARAKQRAVGGMVYLGWGRTLVAKYAASRQDCFNLRPNNVLFWEGMQWGCRSGFETFDMGRTELENTGLRNFKSRWGAIERPLCYSVISDRSHRTNGGRSTKITEFIIRHLPLWVCRLSGELLYRHFG